MLARAIEAQGRPVIRASVDDFHNPRKERYRRGPTVVAQSWWESEVALSPA
jgi:uridine kinase